MYSARPGLILGFHGCDQSIVETVVHKNQHLRSSTNNYDWLGHGTYFWENSPSRALDFATSLSKRTGSSIKKPAVIGAVIDLGYCLDLLDFENLNLLKETYTFLKKTLDDSEFELLRNKAPKGNEQDLLIRTLDCAVIQTLHEVRESKGLRPFDSVRGVFWEGDYIYPSAGFREKDHIQICIRNPNCIKGCFLPRNADSAFDLV